MKKELFKTTFILPALFSIVAMTSCGKKTYTVPTFEHTGKRINFIAYSGPTISAFGNIDTIDDEHYAEVAEAGFTGIYALYDGCVSANMSDKMKNLEVRAAKAEEDAARALPLCEKYNLSYFVRDWNIYGMSRASEPTFAQGINCYNEYKAAFEYIFGRDSTYIHHPNFRGNNVFDEPMYDELDEIGDVVKAYLEVMNEKGAPKAQPNVNLLPAHSGSSCFGIKGYKGYIEKYIEKIGKQIGYISYDLYPFMQHKTGSTIKPTFLYNLQFVKESAQANNLEMRTYVQTRGDFTGMRNMTSVGDLRFQIYTSLAFGSRDMTFYEYGSKEDQTDSEFALVNLTAGTKNWNWYCAKTVNNEVHAMEDALFAYDYENVTFKTAEDGIVNPLFNFLIHHEEKFKEAEILSCTQDTLMTSMKSLVGGPKGYMLLNSSDPYFNHEDKVTMKFPNAKALLMYRLGQKIVVELPRNHEYTFNLIPGEGRMIIPLS